jgi:hypothetical protein
MTKGGKREGAGRPLGSTAGREVVQVAVRLTEQQRDTLNSLGGVRWLRRVLDEVKEGTKVLSVNNSST